MDNRVFWSVLCALLVFSGVVAVAYAIRDYRERQAFQEVVAGIAQVGQQVLQQNQAQAEANAQNDVRARRLNLALLAAETLASNQRCVDGQVLQVDGSTYTQVGTIAQPVHCLGRLADRPIRPVRIPD